MRILVAEDETIIRLDLVEMLARAGLEVLHLWSVGPGQYARHPPDLDHPEWLVVAQRANSREP